MYSLDCYLYFWAYPVYFLAFLFFHFFNFLVPRGRLNWLNPAFKYVKIAYCIDTSESSFNLQIIHAQYS